MSERSPKRGFAARPADPESWIKTPERPIQRVLPAEVFSARLTIDVTTDMRGRIKIAAFQRGQTVADMLRALFEREFPPASGEGQ
ncbi:MAG TPA: chromosome partitioning protein ParB [Burkholderiaceae bacterium]|nr:chromosome partitioning protein ParB [Burkholderiaceae bacterium]